MEQTNEYMPQVSDCILGMFDTYNSGISKDQFYSMNIVDATDVTESDMRVVNDGVIEYCKENGCYAALPPFEEGAFIDRSERRYTHWKVLDIQEDYFLLELNHYPIIFVDSETQDRIVIGDSANISHPCWYRSCKSVIKVKLLTPEEHIEMLSRHPDFTMYAAAGMSRADMARKLSQYLKTEYHVGGVVEDYEYYMSRDLKKMVKKGKYYTSDGKFVNGNWVKEVLADTLELDADNGLNSILFCSTGPIIEMFVYINYMLSQKSTGSSTLRTVTTSYTVDSNVQELRKERHFGKLKVISEKKPRSVNAQNVHRVYSTLAWQRRSHLRHYKSGKVVPVKAATCKRHTTDEVQVPQVVYKV